MDKLEVVKCANGYIVRLSNNDTQYQYDTIKYCHVFNSWEECSAFMLNTLEGNNARR